MSGLQFGDLATRSGRNNSLQYPTAEAIRNSLKVHELSSPDVIDKLLSFKISLKSLLCKTNTTLTSPVPSLPSQTSLSSHIPCSFFWKNYFRTTTIRRNTYAQVNIPYRKVCEDMVLDNIWQLQNHLGSFPAFGHL